ncbi:DnaJ family domain-containing protein [Geobacillus sp. G4]|uniref:Chaperone protein DnaJ n=1 Tax=Geobacillus kaustophilus GBlys TaxID=1337888 RepID=U2WVE1_GEOKU|nr:MULTISPECIES: DnaJ family domain-containing protein [Geobacillus]EQB96465.1 molecular chaperone DnaJ [Geobacillus sp. A8]GAD14761.1 chaperone protein DnaJ [Geobacillus kaustophilus GBlys]
MGGFWRIAEEKIREAMKNGEFDNLPGFGKPLEIEDLSRIPEELRLGYLLLKNAGYVREEAELRKELLTLEDLLRCCEDDEEKRELEKKRTEKQLRLAELMKKRGQTNSKALRDYGRRIEEKFR